MTSCTRRRFVKAAATLAATAPLSGASARTQPAPLDAVAMAEAIRTGRTSAQTQVEAAIARLEQINSTINAVAYPNFARARAMAAADTAGPLGGVPTLIKDIVPEKGLPYTSGSRAYRARLGAVDFPYLAALRQTGVISIGRSTTPEFGLTATTEPLLTGPTRNPWNPDHSPGGSSGGSAAAVAAGVVPVAHASDGGGSIRIPASCSGLVGLKPSRGRMAGQTGDRSISDISVHNCLSRTVRDTAAWFAATEATGPDRQYAPVGLVTGPSRRRLRIAARLVGGNGQLPHNDVQRVFTEALILLQRLGHRVNEAPLLPHSAEFAEAFPILWGAGAARDVQRVRQHLGREPTPRDLEPLTLGMAAVGAKAAEAGIKQAIATLALAARAYNAQFDATDIHMTPVLAEPPVRIGVLAPGISYEQQRSRLSSYVAYTPFENVAGAPAIALPIGKSHNGLPIGIQFAARPGGERMLLELAYELERELEWYRRTPPLWVG